MALSPIFAAAADDIHAAFADVTITLQPTTGPTITDVPAVPLDFTGDDPFGDGRSVSQRGFEVQYSALAARPVNGTTVIVGDEQLRIIEVDDRDAVGAWWLMVETK
jgi:hypothetical protein